MHFRTNGDLPPTIREYPTEVQNLYRTEFNKNFPDSRDLIKPNSEELAHEAAWKAIRKSFDLENDTWDKE